MDNNDRIKELRKKYSDTFSVAAFTNPIEYVVFLEAEVLTLQDNLRIERYHKANNKHSNCFLAVVRSRIFIWLWFIPAALLYYILLIFTNPAQYLFTGKATIAQKFHKWVERQI